MNKYPTQQKGNYKLNVQRDIAMLSTRETTNSSPPIKLTAPKSHRLVVYLQLTMTVSRSSIHSSPMTGG